MQTVAGKYIIAAGILIILVGVMIYFFGNKFSWVGSLPGDIKINKPCFKFYFPLTTMLLISAIINVILYLVKRFL